MSLVGWLGITPFAALKAQVLIPMETKQQRLEAMALSGLAHQSAHHRAGPGAFRSGRGLLCSFDLALCLMGHECFQEIQT